jgi:hypothetical protein
MMCDDGQLGLAGLKGSHPNNQPFVRLVYLVVEEASKK